MKEPRISDKDILDFIGRKDGTTYQELEEQTGYSRISLIIKIRGFLENGMVAKKEPFPLTRFYIPPREG